MAERALVRAEVHFSLPRVPHSSSIQFTNIDLLYRGVVGERVKQASPTLIMKMESQDVCLYTCVNCYTHMCTIIAKQLIADIVNCELAEKMRSHLHQVIGQSGCL